MLEVRVKGREIVYVYRSSSTINEINIDVYKRQTKILIVDWFNEHLGKMSEFGCSSYDTQSNHLFVDKNQQCGIKPRLVYDDGG